MKKPDLDLFVSENVYFPSHQVTMYFNHYTFIKHGNINVYWMLGHKAALYLWSFVMLFVYRCKREYYLSEFKGLFIIYGELNVSENKCIINNLICQLSRGDCSYSLCIGARRGHGQKNLFYKLHRLQLFQFSISGLLWVLSWKLMLYIYLLLYFAPLGTIPRNYTTFKYFSWQYPAFKAKCVTSASWFYIDQQPLNHRLLVQKCTCIDEMFW